MNKQTLILTALPNGYNANGRARLSVFVTPRLWSDEVDAPVLDLSAFPDLLDWPARLAALGWSAAIDGGANVALDVDSAGPDPMLWSALFRADTQVIPYRFDDYRGVPIDSFSAFTVHDLLVDLYGRASADPAYGAGVDRPSLGVLAVDRDITAIARPSVPEPEPVWTDPGTGPVPFPGAPPVIEPAPTWPDPPVPDATPASGCGCGCLLWPLQLLAWLLSLVFGSKVGAWAPGGTAPTSPDAPSSTPASTPSYNVSVDPPATAVPPATPKKSFLPPALDATQQARHDAFTALAAFLEPYAALTLPTQAELTSEWDFHQALSALGDYPAIMRQLGLVVDLLLPPEQDLPAQGHIRLSTTGNGWTTETTVAAPRTHFRADAVRFTALPRSTDPEIIDGFLRVDDEARFRVVQNDVAGDATKLQNAATHALRFASAVDRPATMPADGGLPALRTAGVSLVRRDTGVELAQQFVRSAAVNKWLAMLDQSPPPEEQDEPPLPPADDLFAEDLVRGYRVDILDLKTGVWRSLTERLGTYDFLDAAGGPVTVSAADEGFVQLASTDDGSAAKPARLRVAETLFTWNGWSLAAPRPTMVIPVDDSDPSQSVNQPDHAAVTPFRIETAFRAVPGSLPRLRFGRDYRLRARVADLAGNSVTAPGMADFGSDGPAVTATFKALRFEPVAPPIVMPRNPPVEGESLERMVVRTPAPNGFGAITSRHVAPPQVAQLTAELHGVLDGNFDGGATSYALSGRESCNVRDDAEQVKPALDGAANVGILVASDAWIQQAEFVTVKYLPDPQARAAALKGLPGTMPGAVDAIAFDGTWPDVRPFRLDLVPIADGTAPAPPLWSPAPSSSRGSGVLTVELPPAGRATVRFSAMLDASDLPTRGVMDWTRKQSGDLSAVEASIAAGTHWAHLPWRELTMVHAVQKPLAPTIIDALAAAKTIGATTAALSGALTPEARSTGRVQLTAAWTDPIDDPAQPAPTTATRATPVAEVVVPDAPGSVTIADGTAGGAATIECHDTHFHRIAITPVAVTRFREYFPVASNTADATTLAGTPVEVEVLNSVRPATLPFRYSLPRFDWSTLPGGAELDRTRGGGGLRIYLDRPWFSSGEGELLGIVFRNDVPFPKADEPMAKLVTSWGADPIVQSPGVPPAASDANFPGAAIRHDLSLAESAGTVSAAGYTPQFDPVRRLWFADVTIELGEAYTPFVRLSLARLQPKSVAGAHLSPVHLTDFIGLVPKRRARLTITPASILISVEGPAASATGGSFSPGKEDTGENGLNELHAIVERLVAGANPADALSWQPVDDATVVMYQSGGAPGVWTGSVPWPQSPSVGQYRVALREFEWIKADAAAGSVRLLRSLDETYSRRLVYADDFTI